MGTLLSKIYNFLFYSMLPTQRKLDELLWAQTFDFAIRGSEWFTNKALNPGRWALGFPGLYILYRTLSDVKPESILELGLGESSKLTFQYAKHYPGKHLTIIEQSDEWRDVFCDTIFDARQMVCVLPLDVRGSGSAKHYSYRDFISAVRGRKYDLIIVDGPWGSRRNSRNQILDLIEEGLLREKFVIIFDDADRRGEKDTIQKIKELLSAQNRKFFHGTYRGKKDTCIICSSEYRFLTSL